MYHYSERMSKLNGTATREIFKLLSRPEIVSFAGGLPASECLPLSEIKEITEELLSSESALSILQYGTTEGFVPFRNEIIKYAAKTNIENVELDNVLPISGGQQGIDLMFKVFINPGDIVLVEDPTYLAMLQILNSYEGKAIGVKSAREGLDLDDLENKIIQYKPKILYVVPTFSNPTGKTYSTSNRKAIAQLTAKYDVMVIEDDPYSKLRFSGEAVPALKSFDMAGNVVYVSSFSKVMSPGLRVGFAIGAAEVIRKMTIAKQGTDLHTSSLSQMIACKYLMSGKLSENVAKSLPIYLERKTAMVEAIDKYMPVEFSRTDPCGGLFIWGEFNAPINTVEIVPEAIAVNVAYIQGQVFYADGGGLNTLRLNYSNASPEKIQGGISRLGTLFKKKIMEAKN